jgi:hypothetical protein
MRKEKKRKVKVKEGYRAKQYLVDNTGSIPGTNGGSEPYIGVFF